MKIERRNKAEPKFHHGLDGGSSTPNGKAPPREELLLALAPATSRNAEQTNHCAHNGGLPTANVKAPLMAEVPALPPAMSNKKISPLLTV